jgi:hypothetical protein
VRNPVEIGLGPRGISQNYSEGLKIVSSDANIDFVITQINPHLYIQYGIGAAEIDEVTDILIRTAKSLQKPMIAVMPLGDTMNTIQPVLRAHNKCLKEGVAVFSEIEIAIRSISRLIQYHENRRHTPKS